jgi:hypothetical protein
MSRSLRYLPAPGTLVEVATRTVHGRLLLKPTPPINEAILGVLGRAQRLYGMVVHLVVVLSNHYHLLVAPTDSEQLAEFMGFVNSNIAREVGRLVRLQDNRSPRDLAAPLPRSSAISSKAPSRESSLRRRPPEKRKGPWCSAPPDFRNSIPIPSRTGSRNRRNLDSTRTRSATRLSGVKSIGRRPAAPGWSPHPPEARRPSPSPRRRERYRTGARILTPKSRPS